jgi:hypothetical protein
MTTHAQKKIFSILKYRKPKNNWYGRNRKYGKMEGNLKRNPLIFKCQLFLLSPLVIQIEKYFFNELQTHGKETSTHSTFSNGVQTSTEHFLEKKESFFFFVVMSFASFALYVFFSPNM